MLMLIAIVVLVVVVAVVASGFVRGGAEQPSAPSMPAGPARPVPPQCHWAWLNERAIGRKSFGYYYRDPMAGPSFHIVQVGVPPMDAAALAAKRYRGDTTVRLGAHETLTIPAGAADLAPFMRKTFDQGGASGTTVLRLTDEERRELALPDAPPWIGTYLR